MKVRILSTKQLKFLGINTLLLCSIPTLSARFQILNTAVKTQDEVNQILKKDFKSKNCITGYSNSRFLIGFPEDKSYFTCSEIEFPVKRNYKLLNNTLRIMPDLGAFNLESLSTYTNELEKYKSTLYSDTHYGLKLRVFKKTSSEKDTKLCDELFVKGLISYIENQIKEGEALYNTIISQDFKRNNEDADYTDTTKGLRTYLDQQKKDLDLLKNTNLYQFVFKLKQQENDFSSQVYIGTGWNKDNRFLIWHLEVEDPLYKIVKADEIVVTNYDYLKLF